MIYFAKLHCLLLILPLTALSDRRPFRSIKSVRETVDNYEVLKPAITYKNGSLPHHTELMVEIPADLETYVLILSMNKELIPSNFISIYHDENRQQLVDKTVYLNCYYQGYVKGHPNWIVTMSTCHGLQGEFGDMEDRSNFFHLEPMDEDETSLEQLHAFYLDTEYKSRQGGCGIENHEMENQAKSVLSKFSKKDKRRARRQSTGTRFVEWVVVIDNTQFMLNGNSLNMTVQRAIMLANGVDSIFRPHGIRVILTQTVTFTGSDIFTVSSDANILLNSFTDYVRTSHINTTYDSMMLFTGVELMGNTIGLAFVGTMCNRRLSTGITQDSGASLTSVASTAAHELGHIFNMEHDDGRSCTCTDPTGLCVMSAVLGNPPPTMFSSCSVSDLNELYAEGSDSCLFNSPSMVVGNPVCGNGVPESNEECDCGSPSECTNNCCDAATCQLVAGAKCASGACCSDQCQLRSYGTECRVAAGDCDIAEYCPGDSNECPNDDHAANGIPCNSNAGYCMEGTCPTHNAQCREIYDSDAAIMRCFDQNTFGDQFRNCGQDSSGFIACDSSDVLCGMLHCMDGNYTGFYDVQGFLTTLTIGADVCRGFYSLQDPFAGQVEDGTRCGDGRVCDLSRCVTLESINLPLPCPQNANNVQCSGPSNGVCNNRGMCTCKIGFEGIACENMRNESEPTDVNECLTENGGCAQICNNTQNSFQCSCFPGYHLTGDNLNCSDTNECSVSNGGCSQACINTPGSFMCSCMPGFASVNTMCQDINECNSSVCEQGCTNSDGSFSCFCEDGFSLDANGITCNVDTLVVEFERTSYEVNEDIGLGNLALRICLTVLNLQFPRNISIYTSDISTQAREDYIPFFGELSLDVNDGRECIAIIILEDQKQEQNEMFAVLVSGFSASTEVVILDDDDFSFNYTRNSPIVKDDSVTLHFSFGGAVKTALCALTIGNQVLEEADCSTGSVDFMNLRNRFVQWTPRITIMLQNGSVLVYADSNRNFRISVGTRRRCSVHLINDGIMYFNNSASIEWGLSGPSDVDEANTVFTCSLNGGSDFMCSSPYTTMISLESNTLLVRPPRNSGGCRRGIPRRFNF